MEKKIEDLTFIDDGMFQAVMHEPGISEEVVERNHRERIIINCHTELGSA